VAFNAGDVIVVNFPGVTGVKRRPAVVLSSNEYHSCRPDVIVGLVTSQTAAPLTATDHAFLDWEQAGLRKASAFRSFVATLPRSGHQRVLGRLSERDWEAVRACVNKALAVLW
jgi:mRNA interferase MazF